MYTFDQLSAKAQRRAVEQYIFESVLEDLNYGEVYDMLKYDLVNDRYNEDGELIAIEGE